MHTEPERVIIRSGKLFKLAGVSSEGDHIVPIFQEEFGGCFTYAAAGSGNDYGFLGHRGYDFSRIRIAVWPGILTAKSKRQSGDCLDQKLFLALEPKVRLAGAE